MRILLVDDDVLFREVLERLLHRQPDIRVVGHAGSIKEAIALARQLHPDLVLMDFRLPDGTGLEATSAMLADDPRTKIVFLADDDADEHLFRTVRSGARGYLLKDMPIAALLVYLRGIQYGEPQFLRQ
ncbi:MAG: response regulator transcription factor [Anaerolineae bacterium]